MNGTGGIEAVTFDFFETLIRHRDGHGRGRALSRYLAGCGYASPESWHDGALYRVFEIHAREYSPALPAGERQRYLTRLAARVFDEIGIGDAGDDAARHAGPIWEVLGPAAFEVYPDAHTTLERLKRRDVPLALISNWHCGLEHFVAELGLASYFDHVVGSADSGFAKPDRRIFERASRLLGVAPERILHVGDDYEADYLGGRASGFEVALLERRPGSRRDADRVVRSLDEVAALVADGPFG